MQPPSGGCVLKLLIVKTHILYKVAAAFGRLCVETGMQILSALAKWQPPSGGCVLKLDNDLFFLFIVGQPPSGGCVLKLDNDVFFLFIVGQPPSGGCVLKHYNTVNQIELKLAAAFGRLCVETTNNCHFAVR